MFLIGYEDIYQIPYVRVDWSDLSGDEGNKDFYGADDYCMELHNTHLASVHNDLSNTLAKAYCKFKEDCWIGARQYSIDGLDDGFWRWTDKTAIFNEDDVNYWYDDQPNDSGNEQECIAIMGSDNRAGGWNDRKCWKSDTDAAICDSPYWFADQTRTFQINVDLEFDKIVLLSIGKLNLHHTQKLRNFLIFRKK